MGDMSKYITVMSLVSDERPLDEECLSVETSRIHRIKHLGHREVVDENRNLCPVPWAPLEYNDTGSLHDGHAHRNGILRSIHEAEHHR